MKSVLPKVVESTYFLPETARRLSNPMFTRNLVISEQGIVDFVENPAEFLSEVLDGLDEASRASIALIFLNGTLGVPSPLASTEELDTVSRLLGVTAPQISQALERLNGSLTLLIEQAGGSRWVFRHPTIADAFANLVSNSPELIELYVRGANLERLLNEISCDASGPSSAMVRVPEKLYPIVQKRLQNHPNDYTLIRFLTNKCDENFLRTFVDHASKIFDLTSKLQPDLAYDSFVPFLAKTHKHGLLPEEVRREAIERIEDATLTWFDSAVFENDDLRLLFTEDEFLSLCHKFEENVIDDLPGAVFRFSSTDEQSLFLGLRDNLKVASRFFSGSAEIERKFRLAFDSIDERLIELEDDAPKRPTVAVPPKPSGDRSPIASIFDDIDE